MSIEIHDVAVIGSGLAGLTAAYALRERGIAAVVLERDTGIGGSWQRRHPQLTLNTHRDLSTLPGFRYPKGTGAFPKRDVVVAHLQAFARHHAFDIRYGVDVTSIARDEGHFLIASTRGDIHARNVVVATGRDTQRTFPDWHGRESFEGTILHAADFGDARAYAGKNVLVIGGGNSGFDILNHLSRVDTRAIWFSVRRGPSVLPRRVFRLSVHRLSPLMQRLPVSVVDRLIAATQWLAFGSLTRLGFPPGSNDAASRLINDQIAIPVDDGAIAAIRKGKILIVRAVSAFRENAVLLDDGTEICPDIVIVAAGYGASSPSLTGVSGAGSAASPILRTGTDTGLWSIGMRPGLTSYFRETHREATRIAEAISTGKPAR